MKILLCTPWDISHGGGISRWAHHIANHYNNIKKSNLKIDICPMDRSTYLDETVGQAKRMYMGLKDYYAISQVIFKQLNNNYDIVHLVSSASISLIKDIYILKKLKKSNSKTIIHFHFGRIPQIFQKKNWEYRLIKMVMKLADKVIVLDKMSYQALKFAGYNNVATLPNPLSPEISKIINKNSSRRRNEREILFVGHLYKTKGIMELIEACNKIPDISLTFVGQYEDNIKKELEEHSNKQLLNNGLNFTGNIAMERVIEKMKDCDVFVLPTYTEGFPNVIIESMACGCAIVTTPVGAIPEMLGEEDGKHYGILVAPKSVNELKTAIEKMLSDKEFKEKCRVNVQQRVHERYNIDAVWEQMTAIWDCTLETPTNV